MSRVEWAKGLSNLALYVLAARSGKLQAEARAELHRRNQELLYWRRVNYLELAALND